jgi:hypothetical protein
LKNNYILFYFSTIVFYEDKRGTMAKDRGIDGIELFVGWYVYNIEAHRSTMEPSWRWVNRFMVLDLVVFLVAPVTINQFVIPTNWLLFDAGWRFIVDGVLIGSILPPSPLSATMGTAIACFAAYAGLWIASLIMIKRAERLAISTILAWSNAACEAALVFFLIQYADIRAPHYAPAALYIGSPWILVPLLVFRFVILLFRSGAFAARQ